MGIAVLAVLASQSWLQPASAQDEACSGYIVDEECLGEKDFVKLIQTALNEAGCDVGAVDGVIGRRTRGWLKVHDEIWKDVSYEQLLEERRGDDILIRVAFLSDLVCSRAYAMSEECEAIYAKWKKTSGAGAFAISGRGGCASASGYGSVSSAKSAVLGRCSKNGTNCKIHDTKAASNKRGSVAGRGGCSASSAKYRRYERSKALVRGSKGCYVVSGARTRGQARQRALNYCRQKGSTGCKVVDSQ